MLTYDTPAASHPLGVRARGWFLRSGSTIVSTAAGRPKAAGLTAVGAAQIASLGSFQNFLLSLMIAGLIQVALGAVRAGFIADFFPSSVIKGLLAEIGVILILKQIPHVLGHDPDPEGDMAFRQPDHETAFSELAELVLKRAINVRPQHA